MYSNGPGTPAQSVPGFALRKKNGRTHCIMLRMGSIVNTTRKDRSSQHILLSLLLLSLFLSKCLK
ncbi:unnamed protein product [Staurois parvus]|uniref:Uncharacterized protein n=1 Tax=Staurois parvus TaxID=386267 RepID=A0ABN9EMC8_9NEOB|nr:unnamed protein product [Staurois parvus]